MNLQRTVRPLGDIRTKDTGSLRPKQNVWISQLLDIGDVGLVRSVELSLQVAGLEEVGICTTAVMSIRSD